MMVISTALGNWDLLAFFFDVGTGNSTQIAYEGDEVEVGGMLAGISTKMELWVTRQFWAV